MSQASPATRINPLPAARVQGFQACVLMSMAFRVGGKVHITTTTSLRILTLNIVPVCSTVDTGYSASCAPFAAAPFLEAITVHIVATSLAKNNRFSRFAIIAGHCFVADGTVSFEVSLYAFFCVIWTGIWFWIGHCMSWLYQKRYATHLNRLRFIINYCLVKQDKNVQFH